MHAACVSCAEKRCHCGAAKRAAGSDAIKCTVAALKLAANTASMPPVAASADTDEARRCMRGMRLEPESTEDDGDGTSLASVTSESSERSIKAANERDISAAIRGSVVAPAEAEPFLLPPTDVGADSSVHARITEAVVSVVSSEPKCCAEMF
jgi:hypothetical protein